MAEWDAIDLAESRTSFDDYEAEYEAYRSAERLPNPQSPAISALELFQRPLPKLTSYVDNFIYAGSLNLVAGEPKAGKSTLLLHQVNAIARGERFLGIATTKSKVLYVTEQNELSFRCEAEKVDGFSTNPDVFVLLPEACPIEVNTWLSRIAFWSDRLKATKSGVLVIDTLTAFAALPIGGENDSAMMANHLMQLKELYRTHPSLAIVLVHHIRKPDPKAFGGEKEFASLRDSRGSTAFAGGVDHAVLVTKAAVSTRLPKTIRGIHTEGRFDQEREFYINLRAGHYSRWEE